MWEYIFGWRSDRPNNHLVFGAAWALAMEHLRIAGYSGESVYEAYEEKFMPYYRSELSEDTDDLFSPKTPGNALLALRDYVLKYSDDFEKYKFLYTEISGTVPIDETRILHFRIDCIAEQQKDGMKVVIDDKTTGGSFGRQWLEQWTGSVQMNTYTHALYCLYPFEEVRGAKIRGTRFLKTKRDFIDHPCWRSVDMMQQYLWNINAWVDSIDFEMERFSNCKDSDDVLRAFPQNPEACSKYFGCKFQDFCFAWRNPIQKYDYIPAGFMQNFWDPRQKPSTHKMELEWKA